MNNTETCPFCLQPFAYEMEYRCVECDEPVCPFCVIEVTVGQRCPSCVGRPVEAEDGGAGDLEG